MCDCASFLVYVYRIISEEIKDVVRPQNALLLLKDAPGTNLVAIFCLISFSERGPMQPLS